MITKFIPYTIDFIPQIEKYLEQQALIGNRLIEKNFWTFVFEEATPQKREYFIYSPAFADKTDKFYSSYLFAKKKYQKILLFSFNKTHTHLCMGFIIL